MRKQVILFMALPILWSCSDGGGGNLPTDPLADPPIDLIVDPIPEINQQVDLTPVTAAKLAGDFCASRKQLEIFSNSVVSAYSVKGNAPLANTCGGDIVLNEDGLNFTIDVLDYCDSSTGQDLILNGNMTGSVEAGGNFVSDLHNLSIVGSGVDMDISGFTWDGRDDDMFLTVKVTDNVSTTQVDLTDVSIKKGFLDFGYVTFVELGTYEFKFIEHFNSDLTKGQLFFYGKDGEIVIVSADQGTITVVHKNDKADPGELVDSDCGI